MSLFIDVNRFIEETSLPDDTVERIKKRRKYIGSLKGIYSENDALGKEISGGVFGDVASAHFGRWMRSNYEIGDLDC